MVDVFIIQTILVIEDTRRENTTSKIQKQQEMNKQAPINNKEKKNNRFIIDDIENQIRKKKNIEKSNNKIIESYS
jgi:alpha-acetolactate decarboxylase